MGRTPKNTNALAELARTARTQLQRAKLLGQSLDQRMGEKRAAHDGWIPDEDWRRDFASVTNTIQHAGNSLIRALEGNKKDLGGLSEEQLEAQFRAEIIQSAGSMTDEQWAAMCDARAKTKR